ncbi:hypothetical protein [Ureaplasma parvum]|uniref:Uncharacterized protein n=2 Tax=Ureaplasma parvum TaxID=134821 RepID=A0AAC9T2A8_UREPR|nr:hypothetical protein [Ureaplasma parvum]ACA33158.1 hypothetical protein UPA3_0532 [Ureaplasma parvum serovar 3 str. ATCC 27815]ASD24994.1 hypothetical protein CEE64_00735 [Ureaplasma parvum]ASD29054.1 hypothetical protein CEG40_02895 [Ureaplasma parvum]ASD29247.1 hypothetical protein CEG41_00895 [Ureaplasma parvum]ASD30158.1 hypothetical protein CEG42_03050 [Ureaplasma parvum]
MNTEKIIQIFLYKTKLFRIQYLFLDVWDEKQYLKTEVIKDLQFINKWNINKIKNLHSNEKEGDKNDQ